MSHPQKTADATALLERFLASGRSEAAFRDLAQAVGGLAHGSALRRTRDPQIAEEVAQNVLAILARKASRLKGHPSLAAWIFQTTRYEAAKAMRAEQRRLRKHAALASRAACGVGSAFRDDEGAAAWREALPVLDDSLDRMPEKDRRLVLERFFEDRSFAEIAARTGSTEAACKMRLKRALEKLSGVLRSRGVTLSAGVLAAGLGSALTAPTSAAAAAALAPQALSASASFSAATIAANTLHTMNTIKSSSIAAAAVIVATTAPFLWQQRQASKREAALASVVSRREALEAARPPLGRPSLNLKPTSQSQPSRTIKDLLAVADEKVDARRLMDALMEVMMTQDLVGMLRLFLPIANLSPEEHKALIDEIENHPAHGQMKEMALEMTAAFAPSANPQETLERMMKLGLRPHSYSNLLSQWASNDPDAALAWYWEKLDAGELVGKGVGDTPEPVLLGELLGGTAKKDPARALEMFDDFGDAEGREQIVARLANSLALQARDSGDFTALAAMLDRLGEKEIVDAVQNAAVAWNTLDRYPEGKAFIEQHLHDASGQARALANMIVASPSNSVAESAGWLVDNVAPEERENAIGSFISRTFYNGAGSIEEWLATEEPEIRDIGYVKLSQTSMNYSAGGEKAMEYANKITDRDLRIQAVDQAARHWLQTNRSEAIEGLPPEVVERVSQP